MPMIICNVRENDDEPCRQPAGAPNSTGGQFTACDGAGSPSTPRDKATEKVIAKIGKRGVEILLRQTRYGNEYRHFGVVHGWSRGRGRRNAAYGRAELAAADRLSAAGLARRVPVTNHAANHYIEPHGRGSSYDTPFEITPEGFKVAAYLRATGRQGGW